MENFRSSLLCGFRIVCFLFTGCVINGQESNSSYKLWYDRPADIWEEALPLGNGQTGAMVFGGVAEEHFALNDHTLWTGGPESGNNPEAQRWLPVLREQIFKKEYAEAQETWKKMQGPYSAVYLPLGDLWIDYGNDDNLRNYQRELDLNQAITKVHYQQNDIDFEREAFINHPSKVMVVRLTADKKGALNFTLRLNSKLKHETIVSEKGLQLSGTAPYYVANRPYFENQIEYDAKKSMRFAIQLNYSMIGGTASAEDSVLKIENADEVTLFLTEATNFSGFDRPPGSNGENASAIAKEKMQNAKRKGYAELKEEHLKDYQNLFNRVKFQIDNGGEYDDLTTDKRLKDFMKHEDDYDLQSLYYQFGRYLLISSSRPGSRPANLQGIWNPHVKPPWSSNYTININTEMNYWLAENTNLSECHLPLFDFIEELAVNGKETARTNYGIEEGWVAHHNSDLWAKTSPVGKDDDRSFYPQAFSWHMGGAWLSKHLWEHYRYNQDTLFLKERAYPVMKGAAQFMMHWLVKDPETGYWVTAPSTSPENHFSYKEGNYAIGKGSAMDLSIIRELFKEVIEASETLDIDKEFRAEVKKKLSEVYPYKIGQHGQIQEWFDDVDDPEDTHRHISHLFGLFPGKEIDVTDSPDLAEAAKVTLQHRGDVSTGWSMAWKINWWARLRDGDHAYSILQKAFNYIHPNDKTGSSAGGGTYPNLLDAHPPFQIDGNFGATAGMTEMLMQSHNGYIDLLPALPQAWEKGHIKGIKARGGFEVDLSWSDHRVDQVKITSVQGNPVKLKSASPLRLEENKSYKMTEEDLMVVPLEEGETVVFRRKSTDK